MPDIPSHVRRHRQKQLNIVPEGWLWDENAPRLIRYYDYGLGVIYQDEDGDYDWVLGVYSYSFARGRLSTDIVDILDEGVTDTLDEAKDAADMAAKKLGVY